MNPPAAQPIEQPPESPCIAPSLSSNSSDSEIGTSPSFDERIKNLDEMFEMWSGGNSTRPASENPTTPSSASSFSSRHKFLELDVNDVKPSDILKSVLSKKSIFDDDFKRLENIGEKYEPKDFVNLSRTTTPATATVTSTVATINVKPATVITTSQLPKLHSTPQPTATFSTQISQALPRLNAVSPMNSPQPQSPYNSPSPSPIVTTPNMSTAKMSNNVSSVQPVKGLQYPFPTHPPIPSSVTNLPNATTTSKNLTENTSSSQDQDSSKTSKLHSSGKNATHGTQDKSNQSNNGSKSSNTNRSLSKSVSVPGSNHSGTVRTTLTSSCSLNMNIKDESNDSLDNVVPMRKTSREEKNSNSKNEHPKKTDLLDRRKWESVSSENSDPASSSEILSERTENERVGRERHDSIKTESTKNKTKSRNQNEIESQDRDERIKYELETKKSDEYEYRRRELESDDAVHNWKTEYNKPMQNPPKEREHVIQVNHFTKSDKHNKENTAKSRESTPLDRQQYTDEINKNANKNSRSNSPNKVLPKRRLSSHESVDSDDGKRFKFNAENAKSLERGRDFKDPNGRIGDKLSKHQRNFNKMNNVHKSEENFCDMDDQTKKDTSFDERKKDRENDKHRSKSDKSSHKSRRNKEEKSSNQFRKYHFHFHSSVLSLNIV